MCYFLDKLPPRFRGASATRTLHKPQKKKKLILKKQSKGCKGFRTTFKWGNRGKTARPRKDKHETSSSRRPLVKRSCQLQEHPGKRSKGHSAPHRRAAMGGGKLLAGVTRSGGALPVRVHEMPPFAFGVFWYKSNDTCPVIDPLENQGENKHVLKQMEKGVYSRSLANFDSSIRTKKHALPRLALG